MNTTLTNHGAAIPLGPTPPPSKTPVTDAHFKTYPFDSWDYFDHATLKLMTEMEAELTELREAVGKIHDVLGEDRASDNTELWKYFSSHKAVIEENSRLKDDLDFRRGLYRYLD